MGNWLTKALWGGDPDQLDCTSGLSRRDVYLLRKSWGRIFEHHLEIGLDIFTRLFQKDPALKEYFPAIKNIEEKQLKQHAAFKAHVIRVMHSLNMAVTHLDEPDVVVAMLHELGLMHQKHNLHRKDFEVFKSVLDDMFSELQFNEATMNAWERIITFFFKHIYEKLDKNFDVNVNY